VRKIDDSYDFYMKIPLSSLTYDKIDELDKQVQVLEAEIRKMDDLTPHDYWRNELSQLKQSLLDSKKIVEKKTTQKDTKNNVKKVPKKRVTKSTKVNTEDNTEKENENEEGAENESKKRKISILD
jgi:hypothetical protein